ncbi:MAG TPA: acyl-CoA dehydrogenase, partial [Turneriella sp.]|nr:acyl-CoA dehydrogenase [Turneriella sp.]
AAIGGIVEGMRENGFLLGHLRTEIAKLADVKTKADLTADVEQLVKLVPQYKERAEKEAVSIDMVAAFARIYTSILLAQQLQVAKQKGLADIAEAKAKVFPHFHVMSRRYLAGLAVTLASAAA